jgi:membrane-associated phospholipid phosphatase
VHDTSPGSARYLTTFRSPLALVVVAGVGLVSSYVVAVQRPVPEWELELTRWINDVPDGVAEVLYPIMQLGTLAGPAIVAVAIAAFRRDWWLSTATMLTGLVTWFGAKGVKKIVERDRPLGYLPEVIVREGDGTGLGYISGHSAVAASAAIMAMAVIPRRWRPVAAVLGGLVGIARIVHGVHLPADVVGGWCFGVLLALGALWLLDVLRARVGHDAASDAA